MGGATGEGYANTLSSTGMHPAHVLTREAIQNSVDARQDGIDKVRVRFRGVSLTESAKLEFVDAAALRSLKSRSGELQLAPQNCLATLDEPGRKLDLLFVEDYRTTGLTGEPHKPDSKFYRFLLSLGDGGKLYEQSGTGGSYGYGKAVYSSASSVSTIFAYTRFRSDSGEIKSRLFGCGFFNKHQQKKEWFTGRAWFGRESNPAKRGVEFQVVDPLEDADADEVARRLCFSPRAADEFGTSVLIVDAPLELEEIKRGAEDWWWPRIVDNLLDVEIVFPDGRVEVPRPRSREDLKPFIDTYHIATQTNPNPVKGAEAFRPFNRLHGMELGACGFKVLPVQENGAASLGDSRADSVALIRGPRMVVKYYRAWERGVPSVVGAFVAADKIDDVLRAAEPPAHDDWDKDSKRLRDANGTRKDLVQAVLQRIRSGLKQFQNEASPPTPQRPKRLSLLERTLATYFLRGGKGPPPPPPGNPAPIHLFFDEPPLARPDADGNLRLSAEFGVSLREDSNVASLRLRLRVACPVIEDDVEGEDLKIQLSSGGSDLQADPANQGAYLFTLTNGDTVRFKAISEPYDRSWSIRFRPEIEPAEALS